MNAGAVDLVGAWYDLGRALVRGRPVDPVSGWPVLTTREAFEVARSWARVLSRMGQAVEPIAWRWLDESRALLAESDGPDELLPSSSELWEVGASLLGSLATRNAFDPAAEIAVRFDAKRLMVANVNDPLWLEIALRRFFIAQGRAEKPRKRSRQDRPYVEISVGEAQQVIELWSKYVAAAKPLDDYRDPRGPWREFSARAAQLMSGKKPDELYPVEEVEDLWIAQRRLGVDLSVLKDNQPPKGWSAYVNAAKAMASDLLDGAGDAASVVGGAAADAGGAVVGGVKDAAGAVGGGLKSILKPLAIGAGILGAGVLAVVLVKK